MNKIKSGFTLIEILIVIAIIGVLSVSLVPNIAGAPAKARDLAKKQAVMQSQAAIESYIVTKGKVPANGLNTCINANDGFDDRDVIFEGGNYPKADTADTNADCYTDEGIYPKLITNANNQYRLQIQVESAASGNHTDNGNHFFWTGTLAPE